MNPFGGNRMMMLMLIPDGPLLDSVIVVDVDDDDVIVDRWWSFSSEQNETNCSNGQCPNIFIYVFSSFFIEKKGKYKRVNGI